jgi:hypothetical protein
VQIGLDPERALVLTGLDPALRHIVDDLTGGRTQNAQTQDALLDAALARGADGQDSRRLYGCSPKAVHCSTRIPRRTRSTGSAPPNASVSPLTSPRVPS